MSAINFKSELTQIEYRIAFSYPDKDRPITSAKCPHCKKALSKGLRRTTIAKIMSRNAQTGKWDTVWQGEARRSLKDGYNKEAGRVHALAVALSKAFEAGTREIAWKAYHSRRSQSKG